MLHKDIYICCMENCGILYVAVILYARMWIEIASYSLTSFIFFVILYARMWIEIATSWASMHHTHRHPLCEDVD